MDNLLNDCYSPHTGEHIDNAEPADWMGRAGVASPAYNNQTQALFWRGGPEWTVETVTPTVQVPESVSRFQALAALQQAGLLDAVTTWSNAAGTDPIHKLALENATEFRRDSQTLAAGCAALGLSDEQRDALLIAAGHIQG